MVGAPNGKYLQRNEEAMSIYKKTLDGLRGSLRRQQVKIANDDGNPAQKGMLIWLGKNLLGQTDRAMVETKEITVPRVVYNTNKVEETAALDKVEVNKN